jgi:predicted nucleic acid-binding protein
MAWVVDTCMLLDVLDDDPGFGETSALCIDRYRADGLTICPVSLIEMAPAFLGDWRRAEEFLGQLGVDYRAEWSAADTRTAFAAWNRYVESKRAGKVERRPVADIQIGAFAMRYQGLLTRNGADFGRWFPGLKVVSGF